MITIQSDLFEFAYVPDWYRHLHDLKCMVLPEAWQFKKPAVEECRNTDIGTIYTYNFS